MGSTIAATLRRILPLNAAAGLLFLGGCASVRIAQFASGVPSMAPQDWMVGTVQGYGFIIDWFGNVESQFNAREVGTWNPATRTVTLTEHITYLQGDKQPPTNRVWHFVQVGPTQWTGTANDVIGTATAEQEGNAWHLRYRQDLPVGGYEVEVSVDDLRLREADNVAVDYSTISKLGLHLATAEIAFVR